MQQSIKDAQGNISTLQNDSKQFKQQFQDVNGNITTIKNDAKSLSSQLSTKVGTSEYNSFKNQTAQELRTKLIASDLNGYAKSADVKVSVDGLNARFDNLNVGGTNLLKDSLIPLTASNVWIADGVSNQIVDDYVRIRGTGDNNRIYQPFSNNGLNADGYYSISFWASNDGNNEEFDVQVGTWSSLQTVHVTGSFKLYKLENVWLGGNTSFSFVAPFGKVVRLKKIKLEKGNKATDWSPSPEDIDNKIEVLSGKITANSNEFSTVYTKITNAKNDAINAIKGDSQWQSMGKIVTNASFLQNANGFAQEVVKTTTPMISGGGVNLLKDSLIPLTASDVWINDGVSNQIVDDYVRIRGNGDNNRIYQPFSNNGLNADGYYSISFWASNDGNNEEFDVQVGTWSSLQTVHVTGSFKLYKLENVWLGGNTSFSFVAPFGKVVRLKKIKLEKGTIATDWSPAPEDLATKLQLNQVIDTADSHTRTISDYLTGSNSRFVQMANYLNMNVGNSSVSINGDGVMLSGNRIKITGKTLIDNAVILDALIKDINANTVKTKKLDASKINVTNLNANNITSGTLSGPNFSLNLDKGNMKIGIADKSKSIVLDNGKIDLYSSDVLSSSDYVGTITTVKGGPANHAIRIAGNDGFLIGTEDFTNNFFADGGYPWGTDPKNYVSGSGIFGYKQNMTIATGPTRDHSTLAMVAGAVPSKNLGNIFGVRSQPGVYIYGRDDAHKDLSLVSIAAPLETSFTTKYGSIRVGNYASAGYDNSNLSLDYGEIALSLYAPNNNYPGLSIKPKRISLGAVPGGFATSDPELDLRLDEKRAFLNASGAIDITSNGELYLRGKPVSINGDLSVIGSKNAIVPSSKGYIAINAYETAEYYFGDIGESQTDKQGVKIINLDPLFLETVNTSVPYQVFLSSYDDAKVWVFARNNNMFIVKSDKPNVKFAWEIKAKRKDYENVRLKTVNYKGERN